MTSPHTLPLTTETNRNDGISSASATPNPVSYASETYYENKSLPAGGTQVTVVHSAGILPGSEIKEDKQQSEYLTNAGDTARKYLPTRVIDALENVGVMGNSNNKHVLPSQETSYQPSSSGVGSLPGNQSEASVAKLPEERALEEQVGKPLGREGVIGTIADPQNVDSIASRIDHPSAPAAQFSDSIVEPFPRSGDGVALQHLARPDVESTEHTRPMPTLINGQLTPELEPPHEPVEPVSEKGHEDKNRESSNSVDVNKPLPDGMERGTSESQARDKHSDANANNKVDTSKSYASDQANRRAPNTSPGKSHKEDFPSKTSTENKQGPTGASKTSSVDNNSNMSSEPENKQGNRKPSVSQRIKGEVKVLAGKLSNDQNKVEAGQALKRGLAT